ncbi:hypothetical protein SAMN04487945_1875 [Halobacterium jilantaiense]|uniref:Uncharacterized protein n=1 Tax=Halobacterium jilantaiense TaxID=355548 RepID=A0A1I0PS67_9EURY|nr:hypothetical protein SAMN04487945_1875 [Halobacterium jilantaiense]
MCHSWEELPIWTAEDASDDLDDSEETEGFEDVAREVGPS